MQAGTYDFIIAPVTVTKERAESMAFVEGYLNTDFQFITGKNAPDIAKLEDLKGKVVTVNKGSAYDSGRAGWPTKLAGRWKASARRLMRCKLSLPVVRLPTSPAIQSRHGR